MSLTHIDDNGAARMVDVGEKEVTRRSASAQAVVSMQPETDVYKRQEVGYTGRIGFELMPKTSTAEAVKAIMSY